ncbi:MAG: hypothetical protein PHY93_20955 [Bacteriovorax sp.]|nr:hypothetical protein [Bacteriovorax sp.]
MNGPHGEIEVHSFTGSYYEDKFGGRHPGGEHIVSNRPSDAEIQRRSEERHRVAKKFKDRHFPKRVDLDIE